MATSSTPPHSLGIQTRIYLRPSVGDDHDHGGGHDYNDYDGDDGDDDDDNHHHHDHDAKKCVECHRPCIFHCCYVSSLPLTPSASPTSPMFILKNPSKIPQNPSKPVTMFTVGQAARSQLVTTSLRRGPATTTATQSARAGQKCARALMVSSSCLVHCALLWFGFS